MDIEGRRSSWLRYCKLGGWAAGAWELGQRLRTDTDCDRGRLFIVGTDTFDPWHITAHLDDEARFTRRPGLQPTLLRRDPPSSAPVHLRRTLSELSAAGRHSTVLLVAPDEVHEDVLQRLADARGAGSTLLAVGPENSDVTSIVHAAAWTPDTADATAGDAFELAGHLVTISAGDHRPARGRRWFAAR